MNREKFIQWQHAVVDHIFALTKGEAEARKFYLDLAADTYDFYRSQGADTTPHFLTAVPREVPPRWELRKGSEGIELPEGLRQRWNEWRSKYSEIRLRHPTIELYDMMHAISESHTAASWPAGYEWKIWKWVEAGNPVATPPFDDRYRIVTPEFFNRLRELRELCGGWPYYENERGVVFAESREWERICVEHEECENKLRKDAAELPAKLARLDARFSEIIERAKSDAVFWQALRNWEIKREAKRPVNASDASGGVAGPLRVVKGGTIVPAKMSPDDIPLDPLFRAFLQSVYRPDDELSVTLLVVSLRLMMREELGLDKVLQWPGGPKLGVAN